MRIKGRVYQGVCIITSVVQLVWNINKLSVRSIVFECVCMVSNIAFFSPFFL